MTTYIDITGSNIKTGPWIHKVSTKAFTFKTVNGIRFAITENNYYLDTKADKIRYQFMSCAGCSWKHSYVIYMEVRPNVFVYFIQCTEYDLDMRIKQCSDVYHNYDYPNNFEVDAYINQLQRKV
ncbi:MAG TPA: hypothetical protein DDW90_08210 [Cyanobacteria bacterium UBA9971]|nr:MAG: hypothetical protein UR95_C0010G0005 [Parcubacteria group bacterium GW2011_GWC1_36_108]HBG49467.1 hypothetical protein [Cyanobacteria bacterium UBA9971]HCR36137.1 hypothetical protein [Candidatus Woesebacteria bacterium]